jgi:hypothetical protein
MILHVTSATSDDEIEAHALEVEHAKLKVNSIITIGFQV